MNRKEELVAKAALALDDPTWVGLINRARAVRPGYFVGKIKRVCEILELENRVAASVRYAAILARDFPAEFLKLTGEKDKMETRILLRENEVPMEPLSEEKVMSGNNAPQRRRFSLHCYGEGETQPRPGDKVVILGDESPGNLLMYRGGGLSMSLRTEEGDYPWEGKVWSPEEGRLLAAALSALSSLSFEEEEQDNPTLKGRTNTIFRFV